ncbi:gliding motility-associated C-terminal domain-containing protein [Flagellimonas sp.]|uniref:T9SS type B sorting domain-containing protein n=1 Tax=Flagellimonas sp. TaxID=2058762 RepID=UPI003B52EA5F
MILQKAKFYIFFMLLLSLFSCKNDDSGSGQFICCTNEIDGNVNNLDDIPELAELDDIEVFNWFTPNGDRVNDAFAIANIQLYENHKVQIFRLNGDMVFESENYSGGDNSTWFTGNNLPQGSYEYKIVIENESVFLLRGYLCLIKNPQENFTFEPGCRPLLDPVIN